MPIHELEPIYRTKHTISIGPFKLGERQVFDGYQLGRKLSTDKGRVHWAVTVRGADAGEKFPIPMYYRGYIIDDDTFVFQQFLLGDPSHYNPRYDPSLGKPLERDAINQDLWFSQRVRWVPPEEQT